MEVGHGGVSFGWAEIEADGARGLRRLSWTGRATVAELGREVGMIDNLRVVEFDHLFKSVEAAVVHVGAGQCDIAQGGNLEFANVLRTSRDSSHSWVGVGVFQAVVEDVVGDEVVAAVAGVTAPAAVEEASKANPRAPSIPGHSGAQVKDAPHLLPRWAPGLTESLTPDSSSLKAQHAIVVGRRLDLAAETQRILRERGAAFGAVPPGSGRCGADDDTPRLEKN